ncbi:unnamed protein product, partial [Brachionus calyciflorus]
GFTKTGKSKILFVHRNRLKKYYGTARPLAFEDVNEDMTRMNSGVVSRLASKNFNKSFQGRNIRKRGIPRKTPEAVYINSKQLSHNLTSLPSEITDSK